MALKSPTTYKLRVIGNPRGNYITVRVIVNGASAGLLTMTIKECADLAALLRAAVTLALDASDSKRAQLRTKLAAEAP